MPMDLHSIEEAISLAQCRWPGYTFRKKNDDEACGPCPICGKATKDGFLLFAPSGRYLCRPGGCSGWIDEESNHQWTKEEREARALEARVAALEREAKETKRRLDALERMSHCTDHLDYNRMLTDQDREWWMSQGIWAENIDKLKLGLCVMCPTDSQGRPSYTMPILRKDGHTLWNIDHRLLEIDGTPVKDDKYRPHVAGLGKQLARSYILNDPTLQDVVLVEGAKKAHVLALRGFNTLGLQGKRGSFPFEWVKWMQHIRNLYICLDPDAHDSALRLGAGLAKANRQWKVRVCNTVVKPDDAFVQYGCTPSQFQGILEQGRLIH